MVYLNKKIYYAYSEVEIVNYPPLKFLKFLEFFSKFKNMQVNTNSPASQNIFLACSAGEIFLN